MADAVPSRVGQINAAGAVDALWLKVFGGEVLTAYEQAKKLKPLVRVRTIASGKSAQFPATFIANARYHTPGTEIVGQKIKHNEVVVTLDDMLIADAFVAQIDELKNHYDVRAPYATELGRSLALFEDRTIAQNIVAAARGAALFTGDGAGQSVTQANVSGTANFDTSGTDLISALNLAKQRMEEVDVPVDILGVNAVLRPAAWYLIANTDKNLNTQTGGQGASIAHQSLRTVSDIQVYKSTAPLLGFDVTTYNATTNTNGVVADVSGNSFTTGVPVGLPMPNDYPSKYQYDLVNSRALVWCEPAVAYLQLLGLQMETTWDTRRQGTLMLAKMANGMGALRTKCAVEIKTS